MKKIVFAFLAVCMAFATYAQKPSQKLATIIEGIANHKSYDRNEYPMGLFSRVYFEQEAAFAKTQLKKLNDFTTAKLSETDAITLELMKFRLQETVDYAQYESYLNPLLSDAGFHSSWT